MRAVIIEDEDIIADVLEKKIRKVAPDVEIVKKLGSLKTARKWLQENATPDLMFMDIQLGDGVSFDLLKYFQLDCPIVFTTAYDEFAIRAFRVNGVDYLLKPVKENELQEAIDKCRKLIGSNDQPPADMMSLIQALQNPSGSPKYKEKFIVNAHKQWMPVNTNDIACFQKELLNHIYLMNGDRYVVDYVTLEEVEELLDPRQFYRANRQCIVNIEAIQSVKPAGNSKLLIRLKEPNHRIEIQMSRLRSPAFKKWLDR